MYRGVAARCVPRFLLFKRAANHTTWFRACMPFAVLGRVCDFVGETSKEGERYRETKELPSGLGPQSTDLGMNFFLNGVRTGSPIDKLRYSLLRKVRTGPPIDERVIRV